MYLHTGLYLERNSIEQPSRERHILSYFSLIFSPPLIDLGYTSGIIHVSFRVKIETVWFSEFFFFLLKPCMVLHS